MRSSIAAPLVRALWPTVRLHAFLRRDGDEVIHKRLFRICREERPHVRRRGGHKRAIDTRGPMVLPEMPNQRGSMDPRHDHLDQWRSLGSIWDLRSDGRQFRIMPVVDDCMLECLALIADASLQGAWVAPELAGLFSTWAKPATVVGDNGSECTLNAILAFADDRKRLALYRAKKSDPRHALIERFSDRLRDAL